MGYGNLNNLNSDCPWESQKGASEYEVLSPMANYLNPSLGGEGILRNHVLKHLND